MIVSALAIFLATMVLVIWQPKKLSIGWSASLGAAAALVLGVVDLSDIPVVWEIVWNATAAFIAIIIISLLLDKAGFFEWSALHVAKWGRGNGKRLFVLIVLLGATVSGLFANDGAALILTPIVMAMLIALGFSAGTTLAFVMAAGFIADTASTPLVVSNLVNIVSADFFDLDFAYYAAVMTPVSLVATLTSLGVLYVFYRKDIPASFDTNLIPEPSGAITDSRTFKLGWWVLGMLLVGFFLLEPIGVPVSVTAAAGALVLLSSAATGKKISTREVLKGAPWHIVIFSLGLYIVVYGLRNAGLTNYLSQVLDWAAEGGIWAATFVAGGLAAGLSSIMNNMPTVLVVALSIDSNSATGTIKEAMVFANLIGSDLGPKMTPIGSLATLLWLHVLASKGLKITWGYYFKVGVVLTIPVLLATLTALVFRLSL